MRYSFLVDVGSDEPKVLGPCYGRWKCVSWLRLKACWSSLEASKSGLHITLCDIILLYKSLSREGKMNIEMI